MEHNNTHRRKKRRYRRKNRFQRFCMGIIFTCLILILGCIGYALSYILCPVLPNNKELEAKVDQIAESYIGQNNEEIIHINSAEEMEEMEDDTIPVIMDEWSVDKSVEGEENEKQSVFLEENYVSDELQVTEYENERRALMNSIPLNPQYPNNQDLVNVLDNLMPQIIGDCENTYDKVKACYTYLVENCSYSQTVKYDYEQDAYLLLTEMKGSCTYYAAAFHYMMLYIGLEDKIISSYRNLESGASFHRWNEISIDNTLYVFDTQWEYTLSRHSGLQYVRFFKTYQELKQNKRTNEKMTFSVPLFGKFVNCIQHVIII